jgi:HD-like signal output (HDOD) protein/CheY-like chemotaxis protein
MKRRILFVDDDPLVLQAMERMLRPVRSQWDMRFAGSGAEALELMAAQAFDVIVTDMRMPRMNGATLLKEVLRRHPATIRFVLSGQADQDLVAQCVGVAHQYLSKPCETERLVRSIQSALAVAERAGDPAIRSLVGGIDALPSLPELYFQITRALERESVSTQELARIIQQDIAMTAKILKLVNSTFFGLRRSIETPAEAITYLGVETVKGLVLVNGIFEQATPFQIPGFTLDDLWQHTLRVASGACRIARLETQDRSLQEEAFVGGILHDLGILILANRFRDAYGRIVGAVAGAGAALLDRERAEFQTTHPEVGAYLLGLWGIPAPICAIVRHHHQPDDCGGTPSLPLLAVHAADLLTAQDLHPLFSRPVERTLDLGRSLAPGRLEAWQALLATPESEGAGPF